MKKYVLIVTSPVWDGEKQEEYNSKEAAEQAQLYYFMNNCQTTLKYNSVPYKSRGEDIG